MKKNILSFILGVIIGCSTAFCYFNYHITKESTEKIDKEIAIYNKKISDIDKEIEGFTGLIPTIKQAQRAIYTETIAALEAKKTQFLHWIVFTYPISGKYVFPLGDTEAYNEEISELNKSIEDDKKESAKYNPCLIKSLIDTRIEQTRLTLSGLERAKVAVKYNLPYLLAESEKKEKKAEKLKQSPEVDKESL